MELLVLMVAMVFVAGWFAPLGITLVLWVRLRALERRLAPPVAPEAKPLPRPPAPARPPRPPIRWPSPERVVVWLAAGLGGLAAVVATLLALVAAIERGWVGPAARTSGGLVVGTALWVAGAWLRARGHRWVPSALSGAGIGTLYGALFAAGGLYHLVPTGLAGAAMVAVTAVATVRAVRHDDRLVAWLALIGGALTPVLVSSGEDRPYALFSYLALLAAGVLAAAARRGWWELVLGAALAVGALFASWSAGGHDPARALPALVGVGLLATPFAAVARSRSPSLRTAGAVAATLLALLALPWVVPIDAQFVDPRTGTVALQAASGAQVAAAVAASLLPLPLVLARQGTAAAVVASLLTLAFGVGWGHLAGISEPLLTAAGIAGPVLLASIAASRHAATARPLLVVLPVAGIAAASADLLVGPSLAAAVGGLAGAACVLAAATGWGSAAVAGLVAVALPLGAHRHDPGQLLWLAGTSAAALALTSQAPILARWRAQRGWAWGAAGLAGLLLFPPLHAVWLEAFHLQAVGLLPLLLAGNTLLGAAVLIRRGDIARDDTVTAVFAGVVLLGIVASVPLQLQERWLTVAWALEGAALAALSRRIRHPLLPVAAVGLSVAVAVRLLLNPWALSWGSAAEGLPILNWTLYTWGVPLICLLLVARWTGRAIAPLWFLAALVGFALVNVEVSHAFQDAGPLELGGSGRLQGMVRSASWAGYGLVVLGLGLWRDVRHVRLVGFGFVMLATVKVFAFDLWDLAGFVRVGSVGCLAVSLLIAALAFERLVLRSRKEA